MREAVSESRAVEIAVETLDGRGFKYGEVLGAKRVLGGESPCWLVVVERLDDEATLLALGNFMVNVDLESGESEVVRAL